ncbi:unnamed protein product [Trichogramma brassicae]|uniref:Uncharacterized protein n=1 Tax=Trichogramma brassicae TaxID=86971 RepID=A0A6H5IR05_9HYME|nr:unnamed protein product [Trichogramma brassicae]
MKCFLCLNCHYQLRFHHRYYYYETPLLRRLSLAKILQIKQHNHPVQNKSIQCVKLIVPMGTTWKSVRVSVSHCSSGTKKVGVRLERVHLQGERERGRALVCAVLRFFCLARAMTYRYPSYSDCTHGYDLEISESISESLLERDKKISRVNVQGQREEKKRENREREREINA